MVAASCDMHHESVVTVTCGLSSRTVVSLSETTTTTTNSTATDGSISVVNPTSDLRSHRGADGFASDGSASSEPTEDVVTDPKAWIDEVEEAQRDVAELMIGGGRHQRRRGIMEIRCARESCSPAATESLRRAARARRAARYQGHLAAASANSNHNGTTGVVRVAFSTVQIREHACILGDNPGGTVGPPLTIDWVAMSDVAVDLEQYETTRPPRRDHLEMQMPASYRKDLLKRAGYTRGEIVELTKPVNIARAQRVRTREAIKLDGVNEIVEKLSRKTMNVLTLGMKKRKERQLLKPYVIMSKLCVGEEMSRATSPSRSISSCETCSMDFTVSSETAPVHSSEAAPTTQLLTVPPSDKSGKAKDAAPEAPLERDISPGRDRSLVLSI